MFLSPAALSPLDMFDCNNKPSLNLTPESFQGQLSVMKHEKFHIVKSIRDLLFL